MGGMEAKCILIMGWKATSVDKWVSSAIDLTCKMKQIFVDFSWLSGPWEPYHDDIFYDGEVSVVEIAQKHL